MKFGHLSFLIALSLIFLSGSDGICGQKSKKGSQKEQEGTLMSVPENCLDPSMAFLLWELCHKPELMSVDYLKYYFGEPEQRTLHQGAPSYDYYWYDQNRRPLCELFHERDMRGEAMSSVLQLHLPPGKFDFEILGKKLGKPARIFYDRDAALTHVYSYNPATSIAMSSTPNSFFIDKATVTYMGTALAAPPEADLRLAHDKFIQDINDLSKGKKINWHNALAGARERVREHPDDADAHRALAVALAKTGNVHDAIGEYKTALSLNPYGDAFKQECMQGLKDLHALPEDYTSDPPSGK